MNLLSKIKTGAWYLSHPGYIPDAFVKLQQFTFNKKKEQSEQEAIAWCRDHAVSPEEAFSRLFGNQNYLNIRTSFPAEYAYARKQEENCPFRMGGPGCMDLLYSVCEAIRARSAIETGVAYGWSTLAMLLSLRNRPEAQLISIDMPYVRTGNDDYVGCVVADTLRDQWILLREPDVTGLPKALKTMEKIDLCHYDSDKSFTGRMKSLPLLWNALKQGGVMISDDIGDNLGFHAFCTSISRTPVIIGWDNKYIGIIRK